MQTENVEDSAPQRRPFPRFSAGGIATILFVAGLVIMMIGMGMPVGAEIATGLGIALYLGSLVAFMVAFGKVLAAIALKLTTRRDAPFSSLVARGNMLVLIPAVLMVGVMAAAITGFNMVKDNASDSNARNRVVSAHMMVEEARAIDPKSVEAYTFTKLWSARRPDDYLLSPWGGALQAPGILEMPALTGTHATAEAAGAAPDVAGLTKDPARAGWTIYAPIHPPGTWRAVKTASTGKLVVARDYLLGIYGPDGTPWWDAAGGNGRPLPENQD